MSDGGTPQASAPKSTWLGRLFSRLFWGVVVFVFVGNALLIGALLFKEASRWTLPFIGRLDHRPDRTAPFRPERGYVLDPVLNTAQAVQRDTGLLQLRRKWAHGGVVSTGLPGLIVNILAVDRETGAGHWLFRGQDRAILNLQLLYGANAEAPGDEKAKLPLVGVAMVVAEQDTNKNGEVGPGDRVSLYVYRMDGKAPEKILSADRIKPIAPFAATSVRVVYQSGKAGVVATYAVPSFKLLSEAPIADLPELATEVPTSYDNDED